MTLAKVKKFVIPQTVVAETEAALRRRGAEGYECFVLWSGRQSDSTFSVRTTHVPAQTSYQLPEGLLVRVDGPALHALNLWLFENEETLGAQVHAHPSRAYHSATDNTYPIVTTVGGLSLVAPDFCAGGLLCRGIAGYRLTPNGWYRLRRRRLRRLLEAKV
jgi:hypothetical protein